MKPSTQQAKTIVLPFASPEDYIAMIPDTKNFRKELLEKVLKLCSKRTDFSKAYDFEGTRRTSNEVDRMMDFQKRQIKSMRCLCGYEDSTELYLRAGCMLWNFRPHIKSGEKETPNSVFEQINGFQYHENWLQNLLCASSLKGERPLHKKR